jgi:hypothetical protein
MITLDHTLDHDGPISCGLRTTARIVRSQGSWIAEGFKLNTTIGDVSGTVSNNGPNLGRVIGITDDTIDVAGGMLLAEGPVKGVTLDGFGQPDFVKYEAITISEKVSKGFQTNDYCPTTITDCTSSAFEVDIFTNNARVIVKGFVSLGAKSIGMTEASALTEGALIQGCNFGGSYAVACIALTNKLSTGLLEIVDSNLTNRDHVYGGSGLKITKEAIGVNVNISRSVLSVETAAISVGAATTLFGGGRVDISDSIIAGNGAFGRAIEVAATAADLTLILNRNKLTSAAGYGSGLMIDCPAASFKGEVSFNATLHTIVRTNGAWPVDPDNPNSFRAGQTVVVSGSTSNDGRIGKIHGVRGSTIFLLGGSLLVDEGPVDHVAIRASFVVTVRGEQNEFLNPNGHGQPRITGGGIVEGWLAPLDQMGPDLQSASKLTLSPNYARQHVKGTNTIKTLGLGVVPGGTVEAAYLFGGGRFVLIADGAWSLDDTGNIKPHTVAPRTVGSAVVLFFDPTEGYWHEEGGQLP